jgi:hypothetical protein
MTEEQKEAFEAVNKINEELFKKYNKKNENDIYKDWLAVMPIVSITFASGYILIELTIPSTNTCQLPEFVIYNSEDNDRIYYEKSDKYESFYKFIKRKFIEIKQEICNIKL